MSKSLNTNLMGEGYPTYEECVAKLPKTRKSKNNTFTLSEDGKTLIKINDNFSGVLIVPEGVTSIEAKTDYCEGITDVIMPDTVTMCTAAFHLCDLKSLRLSKNLKELPSFFGDRYAGEELVLPEGIKVIGNYAFSSSKSVRLQLPSTVEFILAEAFSNSKIKELVIPASVKVIFEGAFKYCPLEKVEFLSNDTIVGPEAFEDYSGVAEIYKTHPERKIVYGEDEIEYIEGEVNSKTGKPLGVKKYIKVPLWYYGSLKVKENVDFIDLHDHYGISELDLSPITDMESKMKHPPFASAIKLPPFVKKIIFPDDATTISIDRLSFIQEINIPSKLKDLWWTGPNKPIENFKMENLSLPNTLESLEISDLPIKKIELPDSLTTLSGRGCFSNCKNLEELILPDAITILTEEAARNGNLKKVKLPANLIEIKQGCLRNQVLLEEIIIPASVKKIGRSAFSGCTNLKKIIFDGSPEIADDAFADCPGHKPC